MPLKSRLTQIRSKTFAMALVAIIFNFICSPILAKDLSIETELVPFLNEFKDLYYKACNKSINYLIPGGTSYIELAPLKYPTIGICRYGAGLDGGFVIDITPHALISPDFPGQLRQIFYHEAAHCLLNQRHVNNIKNFMFPIIYEMPREQLEQQLLEIMRANCDFKNY